jgi:photosystem II oxygen-evolving enhancer protein 1
MRFYTYALILLTMFLSLFWGSPALAATNLPLTYDQIKGTGLANKCPEILGASRGRGIIPLAPGQTVSFSDMCLEPTAFFIREEATKKRKEPELVPGKLVTRATSSLDFVKGTLVANPDGSITLTEKEGLDYQPITIQMPGGERVAILFTIKGYKATTQAGLGGITPSTDFAGETDVPTYRGANFIDPKGRGLAIGYDAAEALTAKRDDFAKNNKDDRTSKGKMSLQVAKVNSETGEIAGTFECEQLSGTDLGAIKPEEVVIRGVFYAKVNI